MKGDFMFGFGNKQQIPASTHLAVIVGNAAQALNTQLELCEANRADMEDTYVRGYLWGWFDATLLVGQMRALGLPYFSSMEDALAHVTLITSAKDYFAASASLQKNHIFARGVEVGRADLVAFAHHDTDPVGASIYVTQKRLS